MMPVQGPAIAPVGAPPAPAAPVAPVLPPTPPMMQASAPPAEAQAPPATTPPDGVLKKREAPETIKNPFERRAAMIVQTANDWAKRLAANLGERPADYTAADPEVVHEMFHFSKYGTDAPAVFWQKHAELLQLAMEHNDPDPYAVAERGALADVYPYRAQLALLDHLNPEQKVARAKELVRLSQQQTEGGNPASALPSITGPKGLPPPTPEEGY